MMLGNVVIIQNFLRLTKINLGDTSKERESIFTPLKIAKWKRYKNAVDGVVLAAIQIAEDPIQVPNGRDLRVQHTYSPGTSPPS